MIAKFVLGMLGAAFVVAGLFRATHVGATGARLQARIWLAVGLVCSIVSAWLFWRSAL